MLKRITKTSLVVLVALSLIFCPFTNVEYTRPMELKPEVVLVIYEEIESDAEIAITSRSSRSSRGGYEAKVESKPEPIIEPNIQSIDYNFNIMMPSNFSREDLIEALNSGSHQGLLHLVDYFIEAEQTYGINALYLMSTIGWESGWGRYTSNTNNIAGWTDPYNGGFRYFNSEYECIMTVASELSSLWVNNVGSSLGAITSRYCPTEGYTESIINIMQERQNAILY